MEEVDLKKDQTSVPGGKAGGAAYGARATCLNWLLQTGC